MSQGNYEGISIREAMEKINAKNNGWFLPNIQRQYVWGNRESSEEYICLLVDSLMRGFPCSVAIAQGIRHSRTRPVV